MAKLEIRLLGAFQVWRDGLAVELAAGRGALRLLAYLVLHSERPVERAHLAPLFWPESPASQARANLRVAVLALRRALPAANQVLDLNGRTLRWHPGREPEVDVARFRAAVAAGTARSLQTAVELYAGHLLPGWEEEWVLTERERLHRAYLDALERLCELRESARDYDEAAHLAERLLADDPLNEAHVRRLMRLHALQGDLAAVERLYRATAALLQRDLETQPSLPTRELYQRLRAGLRASSRQPERRPRPAARGGRGGRTRLGDVVEAIDTRLFVGRQEELEVFRRWLTAPGDAPELLEVSGPGGIGKSTLLRACSALARQLGWQTLWVDVRQIPGTPKGLWAALGGRSEADALARLTRLRPLLVLDTCEELGELGRYLRERLLPRLDPHVRVVMAGRYGLDAAWHLDSPWRRLIRSITLKTFTGTEARDYLKRRGITDPALLDQLTAATGGNPLALSLAADLVLRLGVADLRAAASQWHLTVHNLVGRLLSEVRDEKLRALLEAASVVRSFDQRSLRAIAGREATTAAFPLLAQLSMVRPAEHGLALHDDVRRLVADELRWREPARLAELRRRALTYCRRRLAVATTPEERARFVNELLFLYGNVVVHSVMFGEGEPGRVWIEDGRPEDHPAVRQIWRQWLTQEIGAEATEPLRRALDAALRWPDLRLRVARARDGAVLGFGGVLPICQESLPILLSTSNSAAVLRARWSERELQQLPRSAAETRLFFFRYLAHGEREKDAVRPALVRDLLPLLMLEGTYYATVASPEVQALVEVLGYRRLPGASCALEGAPIPEQGYELDLTRCGFDGWIDGLLARSAGALRNAIPAGTVQ